MPFDFKWILTADLDLRNTYEVYTPAYNGYIDFGNLWCAYCAYLKGFFKKKRQTNTGGCLSYNVFISIFLLGTPGYANHEAILEGLSVL